MTHRISLTTCLAAAALLVAACGDEPPRGATAGGARDESREEVPAAGEPRTKLERARIDAQLNFARCMREQGLEFPDPRPNPDGSYLHEPPEDQQKRAAYDRAGAICVEHLDAIQDVELTPSERRELAAAIDRDRVFARCMRSKGYRWPDPIPSEGGFRGDELEAAGIDPDDPRVERDERDCMRAAGQPVPPAGDEPR